MEFTVYAVEPKNQWGSQDLGGVVVSFAHTSGRVEGELKLTFRGTAEEMQAVMDRYVPTQARRQGTTVDLPLDMVIEPVMVTPLAEISQNGPTPWQRWIARWNFRRRI